MTEITGDELPTRWEIELEFVQSLSNIQYLNYLAQNNYLNNDEFLNYLNYLNYWKDPQYAKYLVYPNCLHILTLLQNEEFRKNIVNPDFMNTVMNDMVKRWSNNEIVNEDLNVLEDGDKTMNGNDHPNVQVNGETNVEDETNAEERNGTDERNGFEYKEANNDVTMTDT